MDCSLRLLEFFLSTEHPCLTIFSLQSLASESRNIVNRFCLMYSTIVSNWFGLSDFLDYGIIRNENDIANEQRETAMIEERTDKLF